MNSDDNELPPELYALNELQKHLLKVFVLLSLQIVDVQATVGALLDVQRDQLVNAGRTQDEADEHIQGYLDRRQKAGRTELEKQVDQIFGESASEELDFEGPIH
jgi:hypothetical protein